MLSRFMTHALFNRTRIAMSVLVHVRINSTVARVHGSHRQVLAFTRGHIKLDFQHCTYTHIDSSESLVLHHNTPPLHPLYATLLVT